MSRLSASASRISAKAAKLLCAGISQNDLSRVNIETFRATLAELEAEFKEFATVRESLIRELQAHFDLTPLPRGKKEHKLEQP